MEEILASIRRIIADDEAKPAKQPEPAPPPAPAAPIAAVAEKPAPRPAPPPPRPVAPVAPVAEVKPPAPPPPAPPPPADVFDLTEAMAATPSAPAPSSFRTIAGESDVVFADRAPDTAPPAPPPPEPVARVVEEARKQFVSMPDRNLLSATTASAVDNAFNSLANTVLGNNARTLEDLVKEMLRPMLKSWLDDNLPGLVDRIVRAEIERVSRGR